MAEEMNRLTSSVENFTGQQMALLGRLAETYSKKPAQDEAMVAQARRHSKKICRSRVRQ